MCHFLIGWLAFPKIFHGVHHYIVNLWKSCVYSLVRYWHRTKELFATGRIIKQWARNKMTNRCDSSCSISSFGIPIKSASFVITFTWNFHQLSLNFSKHDLYKIVRRWPILQSFARKCSRYQSPRWMCNLQFFTSLLLMSYKLFRDTQHAITVNTKYPSRHHIT